MAVATLPGEKKKRVFQRSRKPQAIKTAVVARIVEGQTKTRIANELGITRNTVRAIANESDIDQIMQDGRLGTMQRVPEALKTLDVRLEKNSETAAIWLLDKCFDNQQGTGKRMAGDMWLNQTLNVLLHGPETPTKTVQDENLKPPIISEIEIKPQT